MDIERDIFTPLEHNEVRIEINTNGSPTDHFKLDILDKNQLVTCLDYKTVFKEFF